MMIIGGLLSFVSQMFDTIDQFCILRFRGSVLLFLKSVLLGILEAWLAHLRLARISEDVCQQDQKGKYYGRNGVIPQGLLEDIRCATSLSKSAARRTQQRLLEEHLRSEVTERNTIPKQSKIVVVKWN